MKHSKIDILEKTSIPYSILHLALPSVLSMLVNIVYNLTDTFFIGKLNDPYQVAGVSIVCHFSLFKWPLREFSELVGAAICRAFWVRRPLTLHAKPPHTSIFTVAIISVLMIGFGLLFMPTYLNMAGASNQTLLPASQYLLVIILGSPFIMMKFALVQLLRAEGAAKAAMLGLFIGTGANIILDPLFIFGFGMGVMGAAIATIIGQCLGMLYYLSYYWKRKSLATPSRRFLHLRWQCYREILFIGIPSSLSQIMMSIGNTISFKLASVYGDHSVAALGVASRVFSIPIFIFIGISIGVQPLIGFNYGAHNYARMKKAIRSSIFISMCLGVLFTLWFALFPKGLIVAFIADKMIVEIGTVILEPTCLPSHSQR